VAFSPEKKLFCLGVKAFFPVFILTPLWKNTSSGKWLLSRFFYELCPKTAMNTALGIL
jgi:hypothetical protein